MNINSYDAVMIIHPDWYLTPFQEESGRNPPPKGIENIYARFRDLEEQCYEKNIPMFVDFNSFQYDNGDLIELGRHQHNSRDVGFIHDYYDVRFPDKATLNSFEVVTGKPAPELSILFGGFRFDRCVKTALDAFCQKIRTSKDGKFSKSKDERWEFEWEIPNDERVGYGTLDYSLTEKYLPYTYDDDQLYEMAKKAGDFEWDVDLEQRLSVQKEYWLKFNGMERPEKFEHSF